jgi:uncharacterized membrane protein
LSIYSSAKITRATKAIVKLVLSSKGTNIKKRQRRSIRSISDVESISSAKDTRATKAIVKLVLSSKGTNIKKRQRRSIRSISDVESISFAKDTRATKAIVKLVLSLKGTNINKRQPRSIRSISDVESMLRHIASEVMMDGNDITGVAFFWAPDDRNEVLTLDDVMAQYPELIVL